MKSLESLCELAVAVGWGASDLLRSYYRGDRPLLVEELADGPVTAADRAANRHILDRLEEELGDRDFGYLSEETYKVAADTVNQQPTGREWVWIIDPLDGTRDFVQKTGEYALHIALTQAGRPMLAIVACPEAETLYAAVRGSGTIAYHRDGHQRPVRVSDRDRPEDLLVVVSRSHRDARFDRLLAALPCTRQTAVGSAGGKIAAIVEQRADVYLSLSNTSAPKDWDFAAPELILTEAGGRFTHFDGRPVLYDQGDVSQWGGRLGSNGHCHDELGQIAQAILVELDGPDR